MEMKFNIITLGCKVNIYESEYVISLLKKNNYEIVDFNDIADIYIINTCTVTNESDRKSRKIIRGARRKNNDAIIVVMGCYSQIGKEEIPADIILGNKDKSKIVDIINGESNIIIYLKSLTKIIINKELIIKPI